MAAALLRGRSRKGGAAMAAIDGSGMEEEWIGFPTS
jgi:hypothetical protein